MNKGTNRGKVIGWGAAALVTLLLVYPMKVTVMPAYRVTIIDQFGKPMAGAGVSELWWQTSAERRQHLEQAQTNAEGKAAFPERTLRAAVLERMIGCLSYLGREGLAASCGSQSSISAAGDVKELLRTDVKTGAFSSEHELKIVLKECDPQQPAIC